MSREAGRFWKPRERQIYCEDGSYTFEYAKRLLDSQIELVPRQSVINVAAERGRRIIPRLPSLPDWASIIARHDVDVKSELIGHENSDAKYAIDYYRFSTPDGKECMMYLWGMGPEQQTSKVPHIHGVGLDGNGIFEHHFILTGMAEINGELITSYRGRPNYHKARPGETHAARTNRFEGAVMAVLLENIAGIPDGEIHKPVPNLSSSNGYSLK